MSAASEIEAAVAHERNPLHGDLRRRAHMAARPPMSAILAVDVPGWTLAPLALVPQA